MAELSTSNAGIPAQPLQNWVREHWKVLLAVCLGLAAAGALLVFVIVFLVMSDSEVTTKALAAAQRNPAVADRLGSPLRKGWLVTGSVETTPASGHAELAIPVSGPKGSATLYVEAHKQAGLWKLDLLQLGSKGSDERLDLLLSTPDAPEAH